jgi:hypothetical protein
MNARPAGPIPAAATTLGFPVTTAQPYQQAYFPTAGVYGPAPDPELRLITCTGHHLSNTITYAREAAG